MKESSLISHVVAKWMIAACLLTISMGIRAQVNVNADTLKMGTEGTLIIDDMPMDDIIGTTADDGTIIFTDPAPDSVFHKTRRDWSTWRPDPKRALWLAIVLPGAGQIYNRKYWKLPIVYGGFVGCIYALQWNDQMYRDYSQAYLDISDLDPTTHSYDQFLHLNTQITDSNKDRFKNLFKKRKDYYRRWRDMSFFVMLGVYAFSVIDAYVDAELSQFDISKDLSLTVEPAVMPNHNGGDWLDSQSLGVSCKLNF